jgi:putative oxidoreductase
MTGNMIDWTAVAPYTDALLRIAVGALLIPHGLRFAFGMWSDTGNPNRTMGQLAQSLDAWGYRPGWLWSRAIAFNHLVCGPLLVLGLFTRPAAFVATVFLAVACVERWRVGRWFWNKLGMEYTVLWAIGALHVLVSGPGPISADRWLGISWF